MKKIIILISVIILFMSTAYGTGIFWLSKIQQNRLNSLIKQLKIPTWEYKLTVSSTGSRLEEYIPIEPQLITKEVEVTKEIPVEKIITIEKIIEKPLSMCADLSKVIWPTWRFTSNEAWDEIFKLREKNQILGCP